MRHTHEFQAPAPRSASERLTIRMATPADAWALRRLAQLDSAPPARVVPTLIAEIGGELHAAMPLDGGPAIADPFRRTAELVAVLATRARQLQARASASPRRSLGLMNVLRPAGVPRS